ncbi:hypothetical protein [Actinoplanes sp. NPDC051851]|uniref:hypothetical protein n=1 Tax=Actinoplanes sp. NPDC051851 TaxID=3154753 RepID=UPI0034186DF5
MSKSWWTTVAVVLTLATIALSVVSASSRRPEAETLVLVGGTGDHNSTVQFELRGKPVHGLYPGAVRQMRITVDNPFGFGLQVQDLTAEVSSSDRQGCPANSQNLEVRRYDGVLPVTIAASGRTELDGSIPVAMPVGATEKCAGARFTLSISGAGRRVDR